MSKYKNCWIGICLLKKNREYDIRFFVQNIDSRSYEKTDMRMMSK